MNFRLLHVLITLSALFFAVASSDVSLLDVVPTMQGPPGTGWWVF